jgi:hypothetical protein
VNIHIILVSRFEEITPLERIRFVIFFNVDFMVKIARIEYPQSRMERDS